MGLLAACTPTPAPSPAPEGTPTATPTPTKTPKPSPSPTLTPEPRSAWVDQVDADELDGLEVTFLHPLSGAAAEVLQNLSEEFNRENEWGVQVTVQAAGSELALEQELAEEQIGEGSVVLLARSELIRYLDDNGMPISDLNPFMESIQYGIAEEEPFLPYYLEQDQQAERQLALPVLRTVRGMLLNRTVAASLGFGQTLQTPQDFFRAACASAVRNNEIGALIGTGGWMLDADPVAALSWLTAYGGGAEVHGQAWVFDTEANQAAISNLRRQQANGCVWLPKYPNADMYISTGMPFLIGVQLQDLPVLRGRLEAAGSSDEWEWIAYPSQEGEPFLYTFGFSLAMLNAENSPAQAQLAGWLFLRWLTQSENLRELGREWLSLPVKEGQALPDLAVLHRFGVAELLEDEDIRLLALDTSPGWYLARDPLQDAFWNLFHSASDQQAAELLAILDRTIPQVQP